MLPAPTGSASPGGVSIRARHCWRAMRRHRLRSLRIKIVSIRARHCWRAMQQHTEVNRLETHCFNPRPPLLAGDAAPAPKFELFEQVSIRARHCWRAMLTMATNMGKTPAVSIRARHCWRAMHRVARLASHQVCFNPRPPLLAGDARRGCGWHQTVGCFNPRPPLLAGDAVGVGQVHAQRKVSIRARHCWRAMQPFTPPHPPPRHVSIRARHCWRAMRG